MISHELISKRFLIWAVTAIAIAPRMPFDTQWTIGGGLSHRFRKLLLCIVFINSLRIQFSHKETTNWLYSDILGVIEIMGLTFLCFITPFKIMDLLSDRINTRSVGKELQQWVFVSGFLSIVGIALTRTVHPNFWCLKKVANIVSGPPVIRILKTYNSVLTPSNRRGNSMSQTLEMVEYVHLALQAIVAIGYAFNDHEAQVESQKRNLLKGFRDVSIISDWIRVLGHAIFLNVLDEQMHFQGGGRESPEEHSIVVAA